MSSFMPKTSSTWLMICVSRIEGIFGNVLETISLNFATATRTLETISLNFATATRTLEKISLFHCRLPKKILRNFSRILLEIIEQKDNELILKGWQAADAHSATKQKITPAPF
eukprot:GHVP01025499.1.p1 GENE.GHVP01025499.1~~GHVP01025499.1.p1  ORF type:complete len:113 (+),score=15.51 GHVP01025499.1:306-644(+)